MDERRRGWAWVLGAGAVIVGWLAQVFPAGFAFSELIERGHPALGFGALALYMASYGIPVAASVVAMSRPHPRSSRTPGMVMMVSTLMATPLVLLAGVMLAVLGVVLAFVDIPPIIGGFYGC